MKFTAIAAIWALSVPVCLDFTVTLFSPAIFTVCFGGFPLHAPPAYHRQLCQVFLSASIVVTESNRAGSLMSSGLPSARVADTVSRGYSAAGQCLSCWRACVLRESGLQGVWEAGQPAASWFLVVPRCGATGRPVRSEEHTSEPQSPHH